VHGAEHLCVIVVRLVHRAGRQVLPIHQFQTGQRASVRKQKASPWVRILLANS
jgi:hypothetical protein